MTRATRTNPMRAGRARWATRVLLAVPAVLGACGGTVVSQEGRKSPDDGGRGGSPNAPSDAAVPPRGPSDSGSSPRQPTDSAVPPRAPSDAASDARDAAADAGCSGLYDSDDKAVTDLLRQYGACQVASDCIAVSVLDYCVVVSTARASEFRAAVSRVTQNLEKGGCSPPGMSCDSVQVKCEGSCTSAGQLSTPPP